MVSALRQRASRQADGSTSARVVAPPVVDDAVPRTGLQSHRARPRLRSQAARLSRLARHFGLALSITAGMVASAIGGALVAKSRATGGIVLEAAGAAASGPASAASAAGLVAEPPARTVPLLAAGAHGAAPAAASPQAAPGTHQPASAADAASAAEHAAAAATAPAPAPALASAATASAAVALAPPAPVPAEDLTFGLDLNGDGIPDALERYVRKTIATPATRVAARHYYRVALPLATRAQHGDVVAHADKQAVFRAAECYLLTAAEDDVPDPPNLNDRAILIGVAAADRMQALSEALAGFDYRLSGAKRQACG